MDYPPPAWHIDSHGDALLYRGITIAVVRTQADGTVEVRTRCYSEGPTHTQRMATATGGRRYVEAWMRKWGAQAVRDVTNKLGSAAIEAAYKASLPPIDIKPDPRKPRRGRKHF